MRVLSARTVSAGCAGSGAAIVLGPVAGGAEELDAAPEGAGGDMVHLQALGGAAFLTAPLRTLDGPADRRPGAAVPGAPCIPLALGGKAARVAEDGPVLLGVGVGAG